MGINVIVILQKEILNRTVLLLRFTANNARDVNPKDNVKDQVSGRKKHHAAFIDQSDGSLGNVHAKGVSIDTELEVGPEFTERTDWLDFGILFGWNLKLMLQRETHLSHVCLLKTHPTNLLFLRDILIKTALHKFLHAYQSFESTFIVLKN